MKKNFIHHARSGFTLIELLVVLGIIGILAGVIYASFGVARQTARDDIRKSELKELQLALELYKAQNGVYPQGCNNSWSGSLNVTNGCPGLDYITGLVPDFIPALPWDPQTDTNSGYLYRTNAGGTMYKILAWNSVESKMVTSYSDEFSRCPADINQTYCDALPDADTYAVYSAGAENW